MRRNIISLLLLLAAVLTLGSCSGVNTTGGGGGNSTLSVTLTDTPPAGVSLLSFTVALSGITLNPPTGSPVNLTLTPNPLSVELTRLQSDSFFVGKFTVSAGTYNSVTVTIASSTIVFFNGSGATIGTTCLKNTICTVQPVSAANVTLTAGAFPLTLSNGQRTGISLDFNLSKAVSATVGVDFTVAGALSAVKLPRRGAPTGTLDLIEDFTGKVTAVSASSVTVQSGTRGTLTGTLNSSTVFHDPLSTCSALNSSCLHTNQTLSVDAAVNTDGSLTVLAVDLIDSTSVDEVEGTLVLTGSINQFRLILSDKVVTSGNTALANATAGSVILVTLSATPAFQVDTAGLAVSPANLLFFQSGILANGQTVMVRVTSATSSSGNTSATADRALLRYTRTTATVFSAPGPPFFNVDLTTLPAIFGLSGVPEVQTFPNVTNFEGVTDVTGLATGDSVSIRALFIENDTLNAAPAFFAAKVRKR